MPGLLNLPPLVTGVLAILPAGVLFWFAFNKFEGHFRDNVVFLYFMGGLGIGALLALFAAAFAVLTPLVFVLVVPVLYAIAPTALLNRKKWQGQEHAVFNGGAMGLGVASITTFAFAYQRLSAVSVGGSIDWRLTAEWAALAFAIAGEQFLAGLLLGSGVADRTPFRVALLASGITAVFFVVLNEYLRSRALLWIGVALALGAVAAWYGAERLLPLGLTPEARSEIRRARRRGA